MRGALCVGTCRWSLMTPWRIPQMSSYFMTLFHSTFYRSHWSHFSENFLKILKNRKRDIFHSDTKGSPLWNKNWKIEKNWFFQRKSNFLHLNLNSTYSKLSFEVHNIDFAQNFQIFTFLTINFPSMINFICWPLAANIVLKRDCFWYQWTAKDQNIYLWSSLTIHVAFQLHS